MAVIAWHLYEIKNTEFRRVSEDKTLFFNMILYKLSPEACREYLFNDHRSREIVHNTNESDARLIHDSHRGTHQESLPQE